MWFFGVTQQATECPMALSSKTGVLLTTYAITEIKEEATFSLWDFGLLREDYTFLLWRCVMTNEHGVTHQTCLILRTWRKLADETNAKNTPKICWKIVPTWGIQTALAIYIMQSQDYPYAKNEYKLVVAIYCTRMTILEQEMTADV